MASRFRQLVYILLLLPAMSLSAAEIYEYEDENGNIVHGSHVPAGLVHKGYKVYNSNRILIREVARELTPQEKEELREAEEMAAEKERQRRHDYSLIRRYTSMEDFERKRKEEVQERFARVERNKGRLTRLEADIEEQQARITPDMPMESDILRRLDDLQSTRLHYLNELSRSEEEAEEYQQNYDYDYKRLNELLTNPELRASVIN